MSFAKISNHPLSCPQRTLCRGVANFCRVHRHRGLVTGSYFGTNVFRVNVILYKIYIILLNSRLYMYIEYTIHYRCLYYIPLTSKTSGFLENRQKSKKKYVTTIIGIIGMRGRFGNSILRNLRTLYIQYGRRSRYY